MDLGSIILGIITLAFFIVPVIYLQNVQKRERREVLKDFMLLAEQQQLKISPHDFWNHSNAIGLDAQSHKLLYIRKKEGKTEKVVINLSEVERCILLNETRTMKDDRIVDRLGLTFTFRNLKRPVITVEFFNKQESMSLEDELQLCEKWKNIIDSSLKELAIPKFPSDINNKSLAA